MRNSCLFFAVIASSSLVAESAGAVLIDATVSATANIWSAGHATPTSEIDGAGSLAVLIGIPTESDGTVTFENVTGTVDYGPCCSPNGADGVVATAGSNAASIDYRGIAGMQIATGKFLAGVFLDDTEPTDSAPAQLTFSNSAFASLSPGLAQSFFVGDGLTGTGSGSTQIFHVPTGATRLFLGFHDSLGVPGYFGDNSGSISLTANFSTVPAPATFWLIISVAGLLLLVRPCGRHGTNPESMSSVFTESR